MARDFGPRQRKRRTHWTGSTGAATVTATGSNILASRAGPHDGSTIVRVRGFANAVLESASAINNGYSGAFGIGIVSTAAATAGVASIPTPFTEIGWEGWLWHSFFSVFRMIDPGANGNAYQRLEIDSKAMRKWNEDETLVFVSEVVETGTSSIDVGIFARVLEMTN